MIAQLATLAVLAVVQATDAPPADSDLPQPLFDSHEILHVRLAGDIRTIVRDIGKRVGDKALNEFEGEEEHPAVWSYDDGDTTYAFDVQVKTRGHFRRQRNNCNFPPLRINFKKGQVAGTVFENQDKVKLVAHCQDKRKEYEQFVLQEYLMYRTYNLLTDMGLRARLFRITYVDTTGERDSLTKYGFLLEDEDLMAARNGGALMDMQGLHPLDLEYRITVLMSLFQYMHLNTDWSVSGLHNIEILGPIDGMAYPIPYDFDWSGIINTPYAKPDQSLRIRTVRDRMYRGFCRPESELQEGFAKFNAVRDDIYQLYATQEGLEERRLRKIQQDLDKFYEIINDPGKVRREILGTCRK